MLAAGGLLLALVVAAINIPLAAAVLVLAEFVAAILGAISQRRLLGRVGLAVGGALVIVGVLMLLPYFAGSAGARGPEVPDGGDAPTPPVYAQPGALPWPASAGADGGETASAPPTNSAVPPDTTFRAVGGGPASTLPHVQDPGDGDEDDSPADRPGELFPHVPFEEKRR